MTGNSDRRRCVAISWWKQRSVWHAVFWNSFNFPKNKKKAIFILVFVSSHFQLSTYVLSASFNLNLQLSGWNPRWSVTWLSEYRRDIQKSKHYPHFHNPLLTYCGPNTCLSAVLHSPLNKWVTVSMAWRVLRLRMEEGSPVRRVAANILNK